MTSDNYKKLRDEAAVEELGYYNEHFKVGADWAAAHVKARAEELLIRAIEFVEQSKHCAIECHSVKTKEEDAWLADLKAWQKDFI